MQLLNDIKINEYTIIPNKISYAELNKKKTSLILSIFQDEIEGAIIDSTSQSLYFSALYSSHQRKIPSNELIFLINDFIHRYYISSISFQSIQIILSSPHFVFCPSEFYLADEADTLLKFAHPIEPDEIILNDDFDNIKIIYSLSQNLYHPLLRLFPSAKFLHSSTAMLNLFYHHPSLLYTQLWLHIHPTYIEIIAKNNKQFLFYNTFDVKTSLDILYFVLFVIEQLGFAPQETNIYISGNISQQHSIFQIIPKYVHSVQIVHHHPKLHILPIDSLLISHHHFITLNYLLCASYQENAKAEK